MPRAEVSALDHVREGMSVYDRAGENIGTVKAVYFGAVEDSASGQPPASLSESPSPQPLVDVLARALGGTELPDEIRERLRYQGFVHVDIPMAPDRIAMAEQIASIDAEGVHLAATRDELVRA